MTFDECEICKRPYLVSGFFVSDETEVPPEYAEEAKKAAEILRFVRNMTDDQYGQLIAIDKRYNNACEWCINDGLKTELHLV